MGSGALFYEIYKPLYEHFCVIFIDLVGMGASSRPRNDINIKKIQPHEALDYFLNHLEVWRSKMKLTNFYLVGHSFGGYITSNYACRYPEHVRQLLLLSPIGIRVQPDGEDQWDRYEEVEEQLTKHKLRQPSMPMRFYMKTLWHTRISMFEFVRVLGKNSAKGAIENFCSKINNADDTLKQVIGDYLYQIAMRPSTSASCLMVLFSGGL